MDWSPGPPSVGGPPADPTGVSNLQQQGQKVVDQAVNSAKGLLSSGSTIINTSTVKTIPDIMKDVFPSIETAPKPVTADKPSYKDIVWTDPTVPAPFQGSLNIDQYLPGPFTGVAPTLNFDGKPAPFTGTAPSAPGVDLNFVYPDVNVSLPAPPALLSIQTVPFDGVTIPTLDTQVPVFTVTPPTIIPYVEGAFYTSALLQKTEADLQRALTDGTWTGLSTDAERGLWERAREREYRQQADALAELERMEALGYAFPPGVYVDARIKLQTETNYTIAGLSREVMIKQAELQLDNVQKARALAVQLESKLIDYANMIAQRAFDATKMVNDVAVQIYNARVQAYTAQVEAFKTTAIIYEAQIKGLLAKVDVYKTEIQAEQIKAEINSTLVQQYKVQVDAALATIEIFKGKIAIIQTQAQIEKLKIDTYAAQIQAYTGQINAFTAEIEAYKASLQAEAVKEQVYVSQVQAYSAQVDAGVKSAQAKIEEFKGLIAAKTEELDAYKAAVSGLVAHVQAYTAYNQVLVEEYKAETMADSAFNELLTKQWEAVINSDIKLTELSVKAAETQQQLYLTGQQITTDATKAAAQVQAQLGAAYINAVHYSTSVAQSISSSASNSASYSESQSSSV